MKINKNLVHVFIVGVVTFIMAGVISVKTEAKVNNIKVSSTSGNIVRVAKGKKIKLKTVVRKLKNKKVTFKSNNPKVAKISANAMVKGIKSGKAKITVTSKSNPNIKTTIKVVVYKNAVKKISLNKNKVSLNKGKQFLLKASVKPSKKVSKVLKYTSNNKKVATVSKNGNIKACGIGNAIITVESTDGSKKKAKCKVEVKTNIVSIKNFSVRARNAFNVELSDEYPLTYEDFKVTYKYLPNSKTIACNEIISVNTNDNIHYEVVISENVQFNSYVSIEISKINGLNKKEIYIDDKYNANYKEKNTYDVYQAGMVGHIFHYNLVKDIEKFPLSRPVRINYSNVPSYMTGEKYDLEGVCNEILNDHIVKVIVEDAKGKKLYINIHLYVGDKNTIITKALEYTRLSYKYNEEKDDIRNDVYRYNPTVIIAGGELNISYDDLKDYEAVGLPKNVMINSKGIIEIADKTKDVEPGYYNITINALTSAEKRVTILYKLNIVEGITIKGNVTDSLGREFSNVLVVFSPKTIGNIADVTTDRNGNYELRLVPGRYDITVENTQDTLFYSTENNFTKGQTYNIKSNFYKVLFKIPVIEGKDLEYFYMSLGLKDSKGDEHEVDYIYDTKEGKIMQIISVYAYLRKGSYSFEILYDNSFCMMIKEKNGYTKSFGINPINIFVDGSNNTIVLNLIESK